MTRWKMWVPGLALLIGCQLAAFLLPTYLHYDLALAVVSAGIGAALVLIVGKARIIMLAAGAFVGTGAYSAAILGEHGWSYLIVLVVAALFGLVLGLILGSQVVKFDGHEGALVTLVFQVVVVIILREASWSGGASGMTVPRPDVPFVDLTSDAQTLQFVGLVVSLLVIALTAIVRGAPGRALSAAADEPAAATAFGIDIRRHRLVAFAFGSAVLSVCGALLAPLLSIIDPSQFSVYDSVIMLSYPVVGGLEVISGGVIGGLLISYVPQMLRGLAENREIVFAVVVLIVLVFAPRGMVGRAAEGLRSVWERVGGRWTRLSSRSRESARQVSLYELVSSARNARRDRRAVDADRPLVECRDLDVYFGGLAAIKDLGFDLHDGAVTGIIGPNGAGKSTLTNVISGFVTPKTGSVVLSGTDLLDARVTDRVHLGVTRTFQRAAVFGRLTILENVQLGAGEHTVFWSYRRAFAELLFRSDVHWRPATEIAVHLGLRDMLTRQAADLDLGSKRLVEIARALAAGPDLLMLDEPVSGLATDEVDTIGVLLRSLVAELGISVLVIEHNISFVRRYTTELKVLDEGELLVEGPSAVVLDLPDVRKAYFGESAVGTGSDQKGVS